MNYIQYIDQNREKMISTLVELIEKPSADLGPTPAQEIVIRELNALGFATESFRGDLDKAKSSSDFCDPGISYDPGAYNVAGRLKGNGDAPSLMLFAHIDTETEDAFGNVMQPFRAERKGGKICGLGAADDKGGVAMMLEAVRTALHFCPKLKYDLTVLSIMGKHGGAYGTLSAMHKGYSAANTLYLHPAETGHGFQEIKNISLGVADLKITVTGAPGVPHDDLSPGINANMILGKVLGWLSDYEKKMQLEHRFDYGSFRGQPSFMINVGSVASGEGYGEIAQKAEIRLRCRFDTPLTPESVFKDISSLLKQKMNTEGLSGHWKMEYGGMKATPARVDNSHPFVCLVEKAVSDICGQKEFIHQYHAGSDIRFPMVCGGSCCVGIGPSCGLPERGTTGVEWIDEEDYITGIKILTDLLLRYADSL